MTSLLRCAGVCVWSCSVCGAWCLCACDTAGAREFIEVGGGGLIFKGDDVADAVSRIKEIMLRKKAMAEKGKKFAEKSAINHYEERIEEIFQSVI